MDVVEGKCLMKLQTKRMAYMLHGIDSHEEENDEPHLEGLLEVLQEFEGVFDVPQGLPSKRDCDHRIPLINPHQAVSTRLYRYLFHQKNEIEKQVQEMLSSEIIQNSNNPFASPVVLVRKADGSWRLYVDYRALNKNTVKEKFPLPLIDDLLDELQRQNSFPN